MSLNSAFSAAQRLLAATAIATCALAGAASASVITTVTYSPTGLPTVAGPVKTLDFTGYVGATTPITLNSGASAVTVSFNGGTIVQGSLPNSYAAPVTGGTAQAPTYYAAPYISTGGAPNSVTLNFATAESYLGLLWGSVGVGDLITLFNGANAIASISGVDVMNSAASFNGGNSAQSYGGSQYTMINVTGGQFTSAVIAQTAGPSFEAANFQYAASNIAVPEPATIALLAVGVGMLGAAKLRRRKP